MSQQKNVQLVASSGSSTPYYKHEMKKGCGYDVGGCGHKN